MIAQPTNLVYKDTKNIEGSYLSDFHGILPCCFGLKNYWMAISLDLLNTQNMIGKIRSVKIVAEIRPPQKLLSMIW
jgi:hypothetical protein